MGKAPQKVIRVGGTTGLHPTEFGWIAAPESEAFLPSRGIDVCNDFGNHIPYSVYLEAFSATRIPVRFPAVAPNLQPRDDIRPTETAPVYGVPWPTAKAMPSRSSRQNPARMPPHP